MRKSILLILSLFLLFSCTEVDNGFKGVVYKPYSGGLDPAQVYPEGVDMGLSWLWNDMITYDCRQHTTTIETKLLDRDGLDVPITASVFHRPIPNKIGYLHLDKGEEYESTYIVPVFEGVLKDIIGKYTAQDCPTKKSKSTFYMTSQKTTPRVQSVVKPKRRKNLVKWMHNNQFGVLHTSLNFGTVIAIESEHLKNI